MSKKKKNNKFVVPMNKRHPSSKKMVPPNQRRAKDKKNSWMNDIDDDMASRDPDYLWRIPATGDELMDIPVSVDMQCWDDNEDDCV